jgi:DNA-binding transcriptional MerR regulator
MPWSTRQLADIAGTTVKAVRHYHAVGLLDEPDRAGNGYKQYGDTHLTRLLQIKRLRDLGVSLSEIASIDRADLVPDGAVRLVDAELAATIEGLQRIRTELAIVLRHRASTDMLGERDSAAQALRPPANSA